MTPADCYDFAKEGCSDAEILAHAEPLTIRERLILQSWMEQVRIDERLAGSGDNLRSE